MGNDNGAAQSIPNIHPVDVDAKRKDDTNTTKYLIIDVRDASEFEKDGHLGENQTDWIHIPLKDIKNTTNKKDLGQLLGDKDMDQYQEFMFLCAGGVRSMSAAKHVQTLGVEQTLFNINGGIWRYKKDVGL